MKKPSFGSTSAGNWGPLKGDNKRLYWKQQRTMGRTQLIRELEEADTFDDERSWWDIGYDEDPDEYEDRIIDAICAVEGG